MTHATTAERSVVQGGHMLQGKVHVGSTCGGTHLVAYVLS